MTTTKTMVFVIGADHMCMRELPQVIRVLAFEFFASAVNGDRMCRLMCEVN